MVLEKIFIEIHWKKDQKELLENNRLKEIVNTL